MSAQLETIKILNRIARHLKQGLRLVGYVKFFSPAPCLQTPHVCHDAGLRQRIKLIISPWATLAGNLLLKAYNKFRRVWFPLLKPSLLPP